VSAKVRAALVAREINSDDVLPALRKPVLVTHGHSDKVVLPAMGEHILTTCPTARGSWYPETGHAPFLEEPVRFNRELAEFARHAQAGKAKPDALRA
jgi:non-heme chloroperoxidase